MKFEEVRQPLVRALVFILIVAAIGFAGLRRAEGPIFYPIDDLGILESIDRVKWEKSLVLLTYGEAMEVKTKPKLPFHWVVKQRDGRYLVGFVAQQDGKESGWWWEVERALKLVRPVNGSEELATKYELSRLGKTVGGDVILAAYPDRAQGVLEGREADEVINLVKQEKALILLTNEEQILRKTKGIKQLQGAVRVLYHCPQGCPDVVAKLTELISRFEKGKVVLAADSGITTRIKLVSYSGLTNEFAEFDDVRILGFIQNYVNRWRGEIRGSRYLVSFTYEPEPGLAVGWWWEENPLTKQIRLVNGNEALAKKFDLFKAGTSPDGEELLGRWEIVRGTAIPIIGSLHSNCCGAPIKPPYLTDPPTSGAHTFNPTKWGIHQEPIFKEYQVRNLEAGGVLVQYNCPQGCSELVAKLESIVKRFEGKKVILAPYPDMDRRIALTAWGQLDKFDEFDEQRIVKFIEANLGFDRHEIE